VIFDAEGVIIMVNAQSEELFGYPRESLLGQHVEMLVPELLRSLDRAHRANLLEDPSNREARDGIDTHGVHSDGTEFSVEISIGSLETKRGTLFTSFIRDVSERRRLEVEAAHFRSVVESSQDAIIGKNLDGIIVSWNGGPTAVRLRRARVIGRSTSILVPLHYETRCQTFCAACVRAR